MPVAIGGHKVVLPPIPVAPNFENLPNQFAYIFTAVGLAEFVLVVWWKAIRRSFWKEHCRVHSLSTRFTPHVKARRSRI
jgi:hypothetical protein